MSFQISPDLVAQDSYYSNPLFRKRYRSAPGQERTFRTTPNHVSLKVISGPYGAESLLAPGMRPFSNGGRYVRSWPGPDILDAV